MISFSKVRCGFVRLEPPVFDKTTGLAGGERELTELDKHGH
jgi:hypothetical protein